MKLLKPVKIFNIQLQPLTLSDGTLLFIRRHGGHKKTYVITAENIYNYIITEDLDYVEAILPLDADIQTWLAGTFPEKGVIHTGVIFGRDASRSFEDDSEAWHEDGDCRRLSYKKAEKAANKAGGCFVHRTWETEGERDAYRQGMSDVFDWQGYADLEEMYGATLDENGITFPEGNE